MPDGPHVGTGCRVLENFEGTFVLNVINGKVEGVPKLPFARVGRRILIKREWADEWLEKAAGDSPAVNANV